MDDGKLNVMSPAMLRAIGEAFDRAEQDKAVVILAGRPGIFSAGFDLKVFARRDPREIFEMMHLGSSLALRLLGHPWPIVAACTGHAYPMGAFLMLASDVRIGAQGPFQIGLNEVAIGLTLPHFAGELARARLTPPYFNRVVTGELLGPEEAVRAGYLDRVVPADTLLATAEQIAASLSKIDLAAHAATKARLRAGAIAAVRAAIGSEITLANYEARAAVRAA
jgi:enoyl-CoA hydratase